MNGLKKFRAWQVNYHRGVAAPFKPEKIGFVVVTDAEIKASSPVQSNCKNTTKQKTL